MWPRLSSWQLIHQMPPLRADGGGARKPVHQMAQCGAHQLCVVGYCSPFQHKSNSNLKLHANFQDSSPQTSTHTQATYFTQNFRHKFRRQNFASKVCQQIFVSYLHLTNE
jgi:hypothetical protein